MQPTDRFTKDHLILSMNGAIYLKHIAVVEELKKIARLPDEPLRLISPTWKPLHELKAEGFAELEYDGPTLMCRLTKRGLERKQELRHTTPPH